MSFPRTLTNAQEENSSLISGVEAGEHGLLPGSAAAYFTPSNIVHVILEILMDLPRPLATVGQSAPVDPDALADNVSVVRRRADAHGAGGSAEHVTKIVRDGLQF